MTPAQRGIRRLKTPRDEGGKSASLLLQFIQTLKVIDALFDVFSHSEHHGSRCAHAQLVRGAMHADPVFSQALEASDLETDFVVQDFRPSARNRVEPGVTQANNRVPQAQVAVLGNGQDF